MAFQFLPALAQTAEPGGLTYAFKESGAAGLVIVFILVVINLFSFTVLFTKLWNLADARNRNESFLDRYRDSHSPLELFHDGEKFLGAPLWSVYRAACVELTRALGSSDDEELIPASRRIMPSQVAGIQAAMERAFGDRVLSLESRMSILASAVSGAPFLGLLGTVWGVMDTFGAIAASTGGPKLQDMAPGVSAALLTTVFALLVAIPAMFGYNYLVNQIRALIAGMENFRAEFTATVERLYVDHSHQGQPTRLPSDSAGAYSGLGLQGAASHQKEEEGEARTKDDSKGAANQDEGRASQHQDEPQHDREAEAPRRSESRQRKSTAAETTPAGPDPNEPRRSPLRHEEGDEVPSRDLIDNLARERAERERVHLERIARSRSENPPVRLPRPLD